MLVNEISQANIIQSIANHLKSDAGLVDMLAVSTPIMNANGTPEKVNSIVPMSKVADETSHRPCPLIGIRSGDLQRAGYHTYDVFVYIRCYNNVDKAYVEINDILSFVNKLLDRQFITIPTVATAEMVLQSMTGEEYDEGFKLNYRECVFRLQIM
jgi:hypothetical protein